MTPFSYFSFYSPQQKLHLSFIFTIFGFDFVLLLCGCGWGVGSGPFNSVMDLVSEHHTMDDAWNCVIPITVRFAFTQDNLTAN